MFYQVYKAFSYSYIEHNCETWKKVQDYLDITIDEPSSFDEPIVIDGWQITKINEPMTSNGEGNVDMRWESGALDWYYDQLEYENEHEHYNYEDDEYCPDSFGD